jgi:hypothetical protein
MNDSRFSDFEGPIRILGILLFLLILFRELVLKIGNSNDFFEKRGISFNFVKQGCFYCIFISFNWFILNIFDPIKKNNPDFSLYIFGGRISTFFFWLIILLGILMNYILLLKLKKPNSISYQIIFGLIGFDILYWLFSLTIFSSIYEINPFDFIIKVIQVFSTYYFFFTALALIFFIPILLVFYFLLINKIQ